MSWIPDFMLIVFSSVHAEKLTFQWFTEVSNSFPLISGCLSFSFLMLSGCSKVQIGKCKNFPLSESIKLLWVGWGWWFQGIHCYKEGNGHCWNKFWRAGIVIDNMIMQSFWAFKCQENIIFFPFPFSFQEGIFRVVAAILHLGNIEFKKGKETDSSEPRDEKSRFHLKTAAELFM